MNGEFVYVQQDQGPGEKRDSLNDGMPESLGSIVRWC